MKILAFDTSSEILSLALFENDRKIGEFDAPLFTQHSSALAPSLDIILKSHRMAISDVDVFAVGLGPGSFTGLRVGVVTAKVLAWSLRKKVVGVSSLEAIARNISGWAGPVMVILDAKKKMLYSAMYEAKGGKIQTFLKPSLFTIDKLLKRVKKPTLFVGDGVFMHREKILNLNKNFGRIEGNKDLYYPKASNIALAAVGLIKNKKFIDPFKLEPLYLHPRDCNAVKSKKKR